MFESREELIENFDLFDNWEDKYTYLIDLGKKLPPMDDTLKTDGALVKGCTSKVWLVHGTKAGTHTFLVDSDAHIVKGILYVLMCLFHGKDAKTIQNTSTDTLLSEIGVDLSPNRRNGLSAVEAKIKAYCDKEVA